jgi:hypothetical protein
MNGPPQIILRQISEDDRAEVLSLFARVFGFERSTTDWEWRFLQNPPKLSGTAPKVCAVLAIDEAASGRIVGHYTVTPTYLNHAGDRVLACQSGDTMVHPDYQGRGLFVRTAVESYRDLLSQGFAMVFGFPNKNSFPGFIRKLDWEPICRLRQYELRLRMFGMPTFYRLSPDRFIASIRNKKRNRKLELGVSESDAIPTDHDLLWKQVAPYEILSIWKDRNYLTWRYRIGGRRSYRFFELRSRSSLLGLCIVSLESNAFNIMDLVVYQKNVAMGRSMVNAIVECALREKREAVRFSGFDDGFWSAVFAGFAVEMLELQFSARVLSDQKLAERAKLPHNWAVTVGDLDIG